MSQPLDMPNIAALQAETERHMAEVRRAQEATALAQAQQQQLLQQRAQQAGGRS